MAGEEGWSCPYTHLYVGYAGMEYFPPNHPAKPPAVLKPVACFRSARDAEGAGYSLAPSPPGVDLVGGIYLEPVDLIARCQADARILRYPVPCPRMIPNSPPESPLGVCDRTVGPASRVPCVDDHAFHFEYQGFLTPPDYPTPFIDPDGTLHRGPSAKLVITAFIKGDRRGDEPQVEYFLACTNPEPRGTESLPSPGAGEPVTADYYICPQGSAPPQNGQLILRWQLGRVTYQVSLHEDTPGTRELLRYIARTIQYVSPFPSG